MANGFLPLVPYLHRVAGDGLTDAQLLERFVRRHDEAAFAVLFRRHQRMVWNVCVRVLRDPHQAEDAFQATFLVLVRKAASIAEGGRLANWLYGVALRVATKARVQAGKRSARQRDMVDVPGKSPTEAPGRHELAAVLDEEVQRLPGKYRKPIVLCYLEGLSNEDAARQLRCPEGTLRVWLTRARKKLRQRLLRRGMVVSAAALTSLLAEDAASAAVPPALAASAHRLTQAFLAGGQQTAGLLASASVAALTKGVLNDMAPLKLKIAAVALAAFVALAGSGWLVQQALADKPPQPDAGGQKNPAAPAEEARRASKLDLTPDTFATFRDLVRPADNEWRHLKIRWLTDVVAARKKAAQQDRPILIFRTGGAGYNDPLGVC